MSDGFRARRWISSAIKHPHSTFHPILAGKPGVRVQLLSEGAETFVLARSLQRAKKESAMLRNQLMRLHRSLRALSRVVARGGLKDAARKPKFRNQFSPQVGESNTQVSVCAGRLVVPHISFAAPECRVSKATLLCC